MGQRLRVGDVHGGAQPARRQLRDEGVGVGDGSARGVDQHRAVGHRRQEPGVDEAAGVLGQRDDDDARVVARQQVVHLVDAVHPVAGPAADERRRHPEGLQPPHGVLGHVIDIHDADNATGLVYSRNDLETESVWVIEMLAYLDSYQRREGRWYFAKRTPLFWYESDITDPPVGDHKMRWPGTPRHDGGFHAAFPSWKEFRDADPGRLDAPVPAPAPVGEWLRTLRRDAADPRVDPTGRTGNR